MTTPNPRAATLRPSDPKLTRLLEKHGSPLLVLDCDRIRHGYRSLTTALPGVELHYAVKALPHPAVIGTLLEEGSSFDLATTGEIRLLETLGVPADRLLHTHPIKRQQDISDALAHGCDTFVVDNPSELVKFLPFRGRVSLLLRVGFRSRDAAVDLAKKYGCAPEEALHLLRFAREQALPVCGLSFHVGSQCPSPTSHVAAIEACLDLFERARQELSLELRVLDIGGGFPTSYQLLPQPAEAFCAPIRQALARVPRNVRLIAEPGRYLVARAVEGVTTIVGKAARAGSFWYYLDDGVYGSFSGRLHEGTTYPLSVVSNATGKPQRSVFAGPTCDSIDIVAEDLFVPELEIGDLVIGSALGAYTIACSTEFNSIPRAKIIVLNGPRLREPLECEHSAEPIPNAPLMLQSEGL